MNHHEIDGLHVYADSKAEAREIADEYFALPYELATVTRIDDQTVYVDSAEHLWGVVGGRVFARGLWLDVIAVDRLKNVVRFSGKQAVEELLRPGDKLLKDSKKLER